MKASDKSLSFFMFAYLSHCLQKLGSVDYVFCPEKSNFMNSVDINKHTGAHTCDFIKKNGISELL